MHFERKFCQASTEYYFLFSGAFGVVFFLTFLTYTSKLAHFWVRKSRTFEMKNHILKILLSVVLAGGLFFNYSYSTHSYSIEDVITAIHTGNANQLSNYFDKVVEITLHDRSNTYSSSQAEVILKDFFHSYGVKSFKIVHKGSNNGAEFCIGNLQTNFGVYRTTIYMKTRSQKQILQEIRFEED